MAIKRDKNGRFAKSSGARSGSIRNRKKISNRAAGAVAARHKGADKAFFRKGKGALLQTRMNNRRAEKRARGSTTDPNSRGAKRHILKKVAQRRNTIHLVKGSGGRVPAKARHIRVASLAVQVTRGGHRVTG